MPRLVRVVLCLMLALAAACAGAPKSLAPMDDAVIDDPAQYPEDAVFAVRAMVAHLQGHDLRGASFSPDAHHALAGHDFDYKTFSIGPQRIIRYEALDDAPATGRKAVGLVALRDSYGRRAHLSYDIEYTLADATMTVTKASVVSVYPGDPSARIFLVRKDRIPAPSASWAGAYEAMRRLDEMPPEGLSDARVFDTHALALFVMDRTAPGSDIHLSLDLPELHRVLPIINLEHKDYRDYHGWRMAIITIAPEMQARLGEAVVVGWGGRR